MQFFWIWIRIAVVALPFIMMACSTEQNTITAKLYHNTTARYNGYFYAYTMTDEVKNNWLQQEETNPNKILLLFPRLDSTKAKTYKASTDEIIKMASLSIQRHPKSRWTFKNYLLVGLARLYACDFFNATITFKYVNTESKNAKLRYQALIYLIRTYTEKEDFISAFETIHFLEGKRLDQEDRKNLALEKAHLYQVQEDYPKMVSALESAVPLLTKKDQPSYIYFIIGQIYQKLGDNIKSSFFYKKAITSHPTYQIEFYAWLNSAQVAEIKTQEQIEQVRKQFYRLLRDSKNENFIDKIYYELGWFEQKQGNLKKALTNYTLATQPKQSQITRGAAFLRMGEIQFDSLKQYNQAKVNYDSAVAFLPSDYDNRDQIDKRHQILDEFVKYSMIITKNDSLLKLAGSDTSLLRKQMMDQWEKNQQLERSKKKVKKRKPVNNTAISSGGVSTQNTTSSTATSWYFENPATVAFGQTEFRRLWGNRPLVDNWRQSVKRIILSDNQTQPSEESRPSLEEEEPFQSPEQKAHQEINKFIDELPYQEEQKKQLLSQIEEAYFKLGDLYFFDLDQREHAVSVLTKLLHQFPQSPRVPETLFKLYRIYINRDTVVANNYANELKEKYPRSSFARSLVNPDYWKDDLIAASKQRHHYQEAFRLYQFNDLLGAKKQIEQGQTLGETEFSAQLELLGVLVRGRSQPIETYQNELEKWMKKYPKHKLIAQAETWLKKSEDLKPKIDKVHAVQYDKKLQGKYMFVVVHDESNQLSYPVSKALEKFNQSFPSDWELTTSNLGLKQGKILTIVAEIPSHQEALQYYQQYLKELHYQPPLGEAKINTFVITINNFKRLYQTQGLDAYLTFFDHVYQK